MKLSFRRRYKSLRSFPEIELPPFVVLTGVNGAGKSHLLQAIGQAGAIVSDVAPRQDDVKLYEHGSFAPQDVGEFSTAALYNDRDNGLAQARGQRNTYEQQANELLARLSAEQWQGDAWALARLTIDELRSLPGYDESFDDIHLQIRRLLQHSAKEIQRNLGPQSSAWSLLQHVAIQNNITAALVDRNHFRSMHFRWGKSDLFQQSFAHMFIAYRELQKLNHLYRLERDEGQTPAEPPLDHEAFQQRYGIPPWEFINRSLADAGLNFKIDKPEGWEVTGYIPQLTKLSSGAQMNFGALSSGEKVLMSLALCVYQSADGRQEIQRPKLLLLDEVDASLHASMLRPLIRTITKTLVDQEHIPVLLTTHSPTTVALAPEESIYVMRPDAPGIHKCSKARAVSILTAEIPTLSISVDGRRQVFVESNLDADRFERLYQISKDLLQSERSLVFIGVGRKPVSGSDHNAGCAQVESVVTQLVDAGNTTVFGLLDWDKHRQASPRLHVLAEGERYAIENCLLDPVLVAALAVRDGREYATKVGLEADQGFFDVVRATPTTLQHIAEAVEAAVLPPSSDATKRSTQYLGGFSLELRTTWLEMNGHELEEAVVKAFPRFNKYNRPGALLMAVVDPVLHGARDLMPSALYESLKKLLEAEV